MIQQLAALYAWFLMLQGLRSYDGFHQHYDEDYTCDDHKHSTVINKNSVYTNAKYNEERVKNDGKSYVESVCTLEDFKDYQIALITFGGQSGTGTMVPVFKTKTQNNSILFFPEGFDDVFLEGVKHRQFSKFMHVGATGSEPKPAKKYIMTKTQILHTLAILPRDTKIIHIVRENRLKAAISKYFKDQFFRKEGYYKCRDFGNCTHPKPPAFVDIPNLLKLADIKKRDEIARAQLIKAKNFTDVLELRYEDMIVDSSYNLNRIYNFLGLNNTSSKVGYSKNTSDLLVNAVLNYQELVDSLKNDVDHQDLNQYLD